MTDVPLLAIRDLHLSFKLYEGEARVLNGVSLAVGSGERVGLVGESGCGKSITARAVLGLMTQRNVTQSGAILFRGQNLLALEEKSWRALRGRQMSMIFQDPTAALNPVFTVADQMIEVIKRGGKVHRRAEALAIARQALNRVSDTRKRTIAEWRLQ